jgi:predicted nucleic acid-binding protein
VSCTLDANILVHASNTHDPLQQEAAALVRPLADGPEIVYLFWPTLLGYLRIVTHPQILPRPMAPREAMRNHRIAPGPASHAGPRARLTGSGATSAMRPATTLAATTCPTPTSRR